MSKIVLYPANGYDFDAADVAAYLAGLTSGVFSSAEDFPVTAAGGLKVTVGMGRGWVHPSRFTGYSITKREADTLTMPLADPSLPRIDRIVMRYDAGARAASLHVLQGTASSTPTAPAISRTELIYDLCLAEITRPAGSTAVTTGQITDTRLDEKLCGIVRDGVTGIPTDELLAAARERIATLEENASNSAAAAKDSAEAAKSSETKSAASEKNAKDSETNAQRALQDTETKHTAALKDIAQARTAALNDVAASTKTATAAANIATQQATAAAGSASTAATKAGEASTSAGAASTSRQAAEKAQKAAEDAAALAGTRAGTDKTLRVEDAPADAAAVRKLIEESLAAQREEDYKRVRYWASNDPTSPASFIGGTWERVEGEFIMGASSAYPVGTTGGSATHTQTTAEMPSHNHSGSTGSAGGHSHSASTGSAGSHSHSGTTDWAGSHSHNVNAEYKSGGDDGESYRIRNYGASWANYKFTTSSDGSHTHSFSTNSAGGHSHSVSIGDAGAHTHTVSIGSTGSGQAMSVLNPYYALYIWVRVDDAA
ncbi:putative tail fiber protein [Faecalibacterium phage FP_Lugh]|uniref:Putative tail fiber protein n=1 Tax=Faecalibacterium phage FP_Lugh TaxID=2070184 RepID=A0A2K9V3F4_9CAUD|nr:head protein [Faecalibacterium phage FP_Lugh]AUV56613.1 putative tail fiber protein [Faecalibacterium phage FP_Lugh]PDX67137.1 hypothetical protein CGS53_04785 [Faecalibacterium prausnitzii]PDX78884.1 hypothetical protein CGS57_04780 [Faecalibacterium prausnitzii]